MGLTNGGGSASDSSIAWPTIVQHRQLLIIYIVLRTFLTVVGATDEVVIIFVSSGCLGPCY